MLVKSQLQPDSPQSLPWGDLFNPLQPGTQDGHPFSWGWPGHPFSYATTFKSRILKVVFRITILALSVLHSYQYFTFCPFLHYTLEAPPGIKMIPKTALPAAILWYFFHLTFQTAFIHLSHPLLSPTSSLQALGQASLIFYSEIPRMEPESFYIQNLHSALLHLSSLLFLCPSGWIWGITAWEKSITVGEKNTNGTATKHAVQEWA